MPGRGSIFQFNGLDRPIYDQVSVRLRRYGRKFNCECGQVANTDDEVLTPAAKRELIGPCLYEEAVPHQPFLLRMQPNAPRHPLRAIPRYAGEEVERSLESNDFIGEVYELLNGDVIDGLLRGPMPLVAQRILEQQPEGGG